MLMIRKSLRGLHVGILPWTANYPAMAQKNHVTEAGQQIKHVKTKFLEFGFKNANLATLIPTMK